MARPPLCLASCRVFTQPFDRFHSARERPSHASRMRTSELLAAAALLGVLVAAVGSSVPEVVESPPQNASARIAALSEAIRVKEVFGDHLGAPPPPPPPPPEGNDDDDAERRRLQKGKGKGKGKKAAAAAMPSTPSRRHLLDSGEGSSLGGWAVNPGTPRRPSTTSARTPRAATTYLPELARKSGRQATGEDHVVSLEQWKPPPVSQLMGKGAKSPRAKKPPSAFPFNNVGAKVSL